MLHSKPVVLKLEHALEPSEGLLRHRFPGANIGFERGNYDRIRKTIA